MTSACEFGNSAPGLFGCGEPNKRSQAAKQIVVSVALTILTAFAAYYCLVNGLNGLDRAYTSVALLKYGVLSYVGIAFGLAAVANAAFAIFGRPFNAKTQVAGTLGAPIAAIGLGIYGVGCALVSRGLR